MKSSWNKFAWSIFLIAGLTAGVTLHDWLVNRTSQAHVITPFTTSKTGFPAPSSAERDPADFDDYTYAITAGALSRNATTQTLAAGGQIDCDDWGIVTVEGSGGDINLTSNPQILAPTDQPVSKLCIIEGASTNRITIDDGTGVNLNGLSSISIGTNAGDTFRAVFAFNGTDWYLLSISNVQSQTMTLTNKSYDANGTGNALTNIDEDNMLDASDIVRDAIEFVIDGGGSAITTGIKGDLEIPYSATIIRATGLCDQSTTMVVDMWVDTYANFPPDNNDSITDAGTSLTWGAAAKTQDTSLTSWTTSLTAGSTIRYNVDSNDNATRCTVSLVVEK